MSKGSISLQKMGFYETLFWTGKRGECALCEHTLTKETETIYHCKDCLAVYVMLDNGNLDYVGRRNVST